MTGHYTQCPVNWIDIAILLVIAWHIADGVRRGFVAALVDLAAFVVSLVVALTGYVQLGEWAAARWNLPSLLARPLAFGAIWIVTGLVVSLFGRIIGAPFSMLIRATGLDAILSIVPSGLKGLIVAGVVVTVILSVPPLPEGLPGQQGFAFVRESMQDSQLATELVERTAVLDRVAREVIGEPISETLTLLTVRPENGERVPLNFRIENPPIDEPSEARMLELLNQERIRAGLPALVRDPAIDEVARAHSIDMLERGYFAHEAPDGRTPFDRMRDGNVQFTTAGENLALAPTVALAHQGLMDSPGHRANILQPAFRRVGIGAARADGRGRMFTQDFAN
jgi:uncharacterized protein YkwD/uncharacterized membrane protein required for colicin V production